MRTGRCLCGHVQFELEGQLPPLVNCHCQFCRRAHGAAFVTIAWIREAAFKIVSGEEAISRYAQAGGIRCFCSRCGTRIFSASENGSEFLSLVVAALDQEPERGPVLHVNLESKAHWYEIADGLPGHESVPDDVAAQLRSLR
jgi:hypothetical protein